MKWRAGFFILIVFIFGWAKAEKSSTEEVFVKKGTYVPFFRDENEPDQTVAGFFVDKYPVTNEQYLEFVKKNPNWRKTKVKTVFAEKNYLEHWASDLKFSKEKASHPVTNASWFAAREYCKSQGKRLMTIAEWEFVSDAQNPEHLKTILDWYGRTGEDLMPVNRGIVNRNGIVGMHGLIWEWVEDFNSAIMAGDSRSSNEMSKLMFCGSGALRAKDPSQYATFMRFGHRSSLKARSVGRNLGFRCVREDENL